MPIKIAGVLAIALLLSACGGKPSSYRYTPYTGPTCTDGPKSRYGNPHQYKVFGKKYKTLNTACGFKQKGIASWYGPNFHGKRTSSGETYDMHAMTAAHKTLPIPVMVKVTNTENGKSIVVRVNDRGPFHKGRIIDLSKAAAKKLDVIRSGTAKVKIKVLGKPGDGQTGAQAPAVAQPSATSAPAVKDYRNRLFVQLGSFSERSNAQSVVERLQRQGVEGSGIQSVSVNSRLVYRVRVGPFDSPESAERSQQQLAQLGYQGHRVVTE